MMFPKFADPVGQAQLKISFGETKAVLPIVHASVKLTTRGPLVLVQQRLKFSNPHPQTLEGELLIPLPENASVCAFASQDANTGEMLFASIVGKEKARKAFETEVRHHGPQATLMEQVKGAGNTYKTRIYPIPGNGTYTIEIHYTDSLVGAVSWDAKDTMTVTSQQDGICSLYDDVVGHLMGWLHDADVLSLAFVNRQFWKVICQGIVHLPMNFSGAQRLSVEVMDPTSSIPFVGKKLGAVKTLPLEQSNSSMACDVSGASLQGSVSTTVVSRELLGGKSSVSVDSHQGEHFFVVYDKPVTSPQSVSTESSSSNSRPPRKVGIFWDTSYNRSPEAKAQDVARELALLTDILAALPSSTKVQLHLFGVLSTPVTAPDGSSDRQWVLDAVAGCAYDGATDLSHLSGCDTSCDYWLIFSDGVGTLGKAPSRFGSPCFPITSAQIANTRWFKRVAEETGGEFFNLTRQSNEQVLAALPGLGRTARFGFLKAEFDPSEIGDVFPRVPQALSPTERLLLTGRLLAHTATVTLCYGTGTHVQVRRTFQLHQREVEGGLGSRYWASEKASFLQGFPDDEKTEEIIGLGQKFNMVTPGTSLLVLKDLAQFKKHNICPPLSRPSLRQQFLDYQATQDASTKQTVASKLNTVNGWWSQRLTWWDQRTEMAKIPNRGSRGGRQNRRGYECDGLALDGGVNEEDSDDEDGVVECMRSIAPARVEFECEDLSFDITPTLCSAPPPSSAPCLQQASMCSAPPPAPQASLSRSAMAPRMEMERAMPQATIARSRESKSKSRSPARSMRKQLKSRSVRRSAPSNDMKEATSSSSSSSSSSSGGAEPTSSISAMSWDPKMPYLAALKKAMDAVTSSDEDKLRAVVTAYRAQRANFSTSPSFYFDVANFFFAQANTQSDNTRKEAWRAAGVLCATSVLELGLENPNLLRIAGYLLDCHEARLIAKDVFTQVQSLRGEEPQSFRDLALVLTRIVEDKATSLGDHADQAARDEIATLARQACDNFYKTVIGQWDHRFSEIEVTALVELNSFRAYLATLPWLDSKYYSVDFMQHTDRFLRNIDCDLRISLGWDKDMTDIDMHVIEPTGEEAYYGHRNTRIGGLVSRDFTQGYGPEEYMLKFAVPGSYQIWTNYFGNSSQDLAGATSLLLSIYTDYGRPGKQKHQQVVLRLNTVNGRVTVGSITVPEKGAAEVKEVSTATTATTTDTTATSPITSPSAVTETVEPAITSSTTASRRRSRSPIARIGAAISSIFG